MKMLLVCPHFRGIEYGLIDTFKNLNVEVHPFFFDVGFSSNHYLQRVKVKLGVSIDDFLQKQKEEFNKNFIEEYKRVLPDIVYVVQGRWMSKESLECVNQKSYTALYLWDMVSLFPDMVETFAYYHKIYSFDCDDAVALSEHGLPASYKPSGYDHRVYYPMNTEKIYDICFVGAMYPERKELLKELIEAFPNLKWEIYGEYAPKRNPVMWLKWRFSKDYLYFRNKNISKEKVNELYNKSKIVLSVVRSNQKNGWSARLPEILGTCTFQLTNYFPAVEEEFNGSLVTYKTKAELFDLIRYYIEHDEERQRIAKNGYDKVYPVFTDETINHGIIQEYLDWKEQKK